MSAPALIWGEGLAAGFDVTALATMRAETSSCFGRPRASGLSTFARSGQGLSETLGEACEAEG
jgi:hypothetical protein